MKTCSVGFIRAVAVFIACLSISSLSSADDQGPLKVFSVSESDFEDMDSNGPVMVAPMMSIPGMTGGIARLEKGRHKVSNWTHWYGEVVYVTRGSGNITASLPPFAESKTYHLNVGDFFYIPVSTRVSFEATSQEPFEFFFAIPAD